MRMTMIHKQCPKCGQKNHFKHSICQSCGETLPRLIQVGSKFGIAILILTSAIGIAAAQQVSNAYNSHLTPSAETQSTSHGAITTLPSASPSTLQTEQATIATTSSAVPSSLDTPKHTDQPTSLQTTPSSSSIQDSNTNTTQPSSPNTSNVSQTTPTPEPQPTITRLDNQTKIKLLTSYDQWNKALPQFQNAIVPSYNSLRNNCESYLDLVNNIHNNYDSFALSSDFSDIKQAQNDIYSKANEILALQKSICDNNLDSPEAYIKINQDIVQYNLLLSDFGSVINAYKQKIDYHS